MKTSHIYFIATILLLALQVSCVDSPEPRDEQVLLVDTQGLFKHSTPASNLITSAVQREYNTDMVFLPSEAFQEDTFELVEAKMEVDRVERRLMKLYQQDQWDRLAIGTMSGSDIRKFIVNRTIEMNRHDLHVAGIHYSVRLAGGLPLIYQVKLADGSPLEDRKKYRVAISKRALDGVFPGYRYRHGFSFSFRHEKGSRYTVSQALKGYLQKIGRLALYHETRSIVEVAQTGEVSQPLRISEIQGLSHVSPYLGKKVVTEGIVTAAGPNEGGGYEFYLQSSDPDGDDRTSEGIFVQVAKPDYKIRVGNRLQVRGVVYEDLTEGQLTRTSLREVDEMVLKELQQELPLPIVLGRDNHESEFERVTPNQFISTYRGNLNQKKSLNLNDGIDFWESLEGMRVVLRKPRIVGIGGGKKDSGFQRRYLDLFLVANGTETPEQVTPKGGMIIDEFNNDFNPEIIKLIDHQFSKSVDAKYTFEVGDRFDYDLEGIFGFNTNLFGGGEYVLYLTGRFGSTSSIKKFQERPITTLDSEHERKLTIASFNVENLSSPQDRRMNEIARAIQTNLRCPDIVNLVEIQDNNGVSFEDNAAADKTLRNLIQAIPDCNHPIDYDFINIDPVQNQEGGEPGGNIRVAMIYNRARVGFDRRGQASSLDDTTLLEDGSLNQNPGRIYPNDPEFQGTRKSLVVEFEFLGERIYLIGNHFNSKGGDTSLWAAQQPPILNSETERSKIAVRINDFCQNLLAKNPSAKIVVLGDFNDFQMSQAIKILQGNELHNLMNLKKPDGTYLIAPNDRYTYNYSGNSQILDLILISRSLIDLKPEMEILHINTDYMGQIADHDPIIARFEF